MKSLVSPIVLRQTSFLDTLESAPVPAEPVTPKQFERRIEAAGQDISDSLCEMLDAASDLLAFLSRPASVKAIGNALAGKSAGAHRPKVTA